MVSEIVGYGCCATAVIFFGTNFIPVKKIDAKDGIWFGWCMSVGILIAALIVDVSPLTTKPHTYSPICTLGGVLWATGNVAGPMIIQKLGMGMAVTVWGLSNMLLGWATGRFGFFGIEKNPCANPTLNTIGVALAVLAGIFFGLVKPEAPPDEPLLETGSKKKASLRKSFSSISAHGHHDEHEEVSSFAYAVAFAGALMAGLFFGSMFDIPTLKMQDAPANGLTDQPLDYIMTHAIGIFLTYSIVLIIYCAAMGEDRYLAKEVFVPAMISGMMWAVAFTSWNTANGALNFVIAFPIITTGPSVVGMLVGILVYGEIKDKQNLIKVATAFALAIGGVTCIALSK